MQGEPRRVGVSVRRGGPKSSTDRSWEATAPRATASCVSACASTDARSPGVRTVPRGASPIASVPVSKPSPSIVTVSASSSVTFSASSGERRSTGVKRHSSSRPVGRGKSAGSKERVRSERDWSGLAAAQPEPEAERAPRELETDALVQDLADRLRRHYWASYGTTLAGLMAEHGVEPVAYLDHVHDIDMSGLSADPVLAERIARLPGRRIVFTNADIRYAARVLQARGLSSVFDALYGVEETRALIERALAGELVSEPAA